ncbi:hypothetical protein EMCRGX_G017397 [Ephydatia muelleri]
MFALADAVPGIDPLHGAETGESLAIIYKNILDWTQIKGFNEKTQDEKKHFLLAVEYLSQTVPDPFNVSVNVTRFHLYRRAEDAYNAKRLEMEDIIAGNRSAKQADEFERWFQRNYPSLNARVEAAYTEWLVFGEKEIVELYKSYLDVQAPGIDLEEARMALRASGVISLDRSRTIYPVSFVPSNWFRYLTDVSKVDKASKIRAMSGDQIRLQIGRLKARRAVLVALKSAPVEPQATKAIDDAKKSVDSADADLATTAKKAEKDRQICLAKRGCQMAADNIGGATDCGDFLKGSENTTNTVDLNSQIYSCAEALNAQLNPDSQKANIDQAIANIDAAVEEYKKALTTSPVQLSQLADHAADDKEQLDANWLQFSFDSAASSQQTDASSSYSSYASSASAHGLFWSASASYSTSKAQQDFSTKLNSAKVAVQGELLRVTIQRPWFRPSLFRSAQYQMADGILVSPGDELPEKEFVTKAMDRNKYLLPHYASGLLLSRNVSVEFRELSSSAVYHAVQESSSFSAGFSVGCFWGSANPLGHHALTCKSGGDSIFRHNSLRDTFWESCKLACIAGQIEAGSGLDVEGSRTRPADILLPNWEFGKPAALDFTITSALNPSTLNEASVMAGFAASAAEVRKHVANDEKCSRLGWVCIPLSVETYGCWGEEAGRCLDRLATRIATRTGCPKSSAVSGLYGRLSIGLIRANARALLARSSSLS